MADIKTAYTSSAAITVTLASLATAAARQSGAIDNSSNPFLDALVGGVVRTGTSPTNNRTIVVYVYPSVDGGTTFTGQASGSDAAYAAGDELNLKVLGVIHSDSTSDKDYHFGPSSVARLFGGHVPEHWGLIVENNTGVALHATAANHEVNDQGIHETL